jgi:ComF family protein
MERLLPPACSGCGGAVPPDRALCPACAGALARLPADRCTLCQEAGAAPGRARCPGCAGHRGPLQACVAAAAFRGGALEAIHRFKYPAPGLSGLDPAAEATVRALLREAAARAPGPLPQLLVPVPLHPRRLRRRGFNPAAELARGLARSLDLPWDATALRRLRDTASQTGLDRAGRRRNVRGAFAARPGWRAPARVWLVDDVVTTGSTLRAAAAALRRAGARRVSAVCVARATDSTSGSAPASRSGSRAGGPGPPAS